METTKTIRCCETCLYMATHEKCGNPADDNYCLKTPDDFVYEPGKPIPYQYFNYKEGNWMSRLMDKQISGEINIVIGGIGEAEVNTKWTPEKTSKHLHYVSEQCGYVTGRLTKNDMGQTMLKIYTSESQFLLVWNERNELVKIRDLLNSSGWMWDNTNPFHQH